MEVRTLIVKEDLFSCLTIPKPIFCEELRTNSNIKLKTERKELQRRPFLQNKVAFY